MTWLFVNYILIPTPESYILHVVRLLCDHGADVSVCDKEGDDAVAVADSQGWTDVLKVLKLGEFFFGFFLCL